MPANLCSDDGAIVPVEVTDLSYDGCGIEGTFALGVGDRIKISVLGRGSVAAEVRWSSEGRAGLRFDPPLHEPLPAPRAAERVLLKADLMTRREGRSRHRVDVEDASTDGCKVSIVEQVRVGEMVMVKFDGLETLNAAVRWTDGAQAGLQFERPIHPAVFDLVIGKLRA